MKNLKDIINEKLIINKDTEISNPNEIEKEFQNKESVETLKFILDCIKRSKNGPWSLAIFNYWDMHINKNVLTCMHSGWSHGSSGWGKAKYIEKCVDNYNKNHGTEIKVQVSGWSSNAGVSILQIKEVVDALKNKFTGVDIKEDDLVYVYI